MVSMKLMDMIVKFVMLNVLLVSRLLLIVSIVLKTEYMNQSVTVQMVSMTKVMLFVQPVPTIAELVLMLQIIVSSAQMVLLNHQNVS
jgi:hypothetical protein